jgi:hypothetical protein
MNARPLRLVESAPVSTLTTPLVVPDVSDVYAIVVHGSELTAPV